MFCANHSDIVAGQGTMCGLELRFVRVPLVRRCFLAYKKRLSRRGGRVRLKAAVLKTADGATRPGVRIPPSPPWTIQGLELWYGSNPFLRPSGRFLGACRHSGIVPPPYTTHSQAAEHTCLSGKYGFCHIAYGVRTTAGRQSFSGKRCQGEAFWGDGPWVSHSMAA